MEAYSSTTLTILILLNLLFLVSNIPTTLAATSSASNSVSTISYKTYIQTACNSTTYPRVCYSSLSPYASTIKGHPQKLCKTALSVAAKAARNASSTISNLSKLMALTRSEAAVIKDCIENVKDSIDELKQSLNEMGHLGACGSDCQLQISNIKTWVSAAITDESTCTDGLEEQKVSATVKNKISSSILNVARPTSNALSLFNSHYPY
ncbi:pectinesterase inhibitor 4-like [Juglans microcarpa x Juglans regia]|uniref:pectinesterase inhibitor 4-like n=1 Tax=Juglans microcarpa x Juglans regia TaxID=2249226 RepID=UPI001B7EA01B|nr:pectinesterase inhibitor 4-like [Juglans microcarpa x Juglans regia]